MDHYKRYDRDYIESFRNVEEDYQVGGADFMDDKSMNKLRLKFQLEETRLWFLTVSVEYSGDSVSYSLDEEAASDSHYEFVNETSIREAIYKEGDENLYLHEVFIRYLENHTGGQLYNVIRRYVTDEYHFY